MKSLLTTDISGLKPVGTFLWKGQDIPGLSHEQLTVNILQLTDKDDFIIDPTAVRCVVADIHYINANTPVGELKLAVDLASGRYTLASPYLEGFKIELGVTEITKKEVSKSAATAANAQADITAGDIVYLKSGSPKLTVIHINENDDTADVVWFDPERQWVNFPLACLTKDPTAHNGA